MMGLSDRYDRQHSVHWIVQLSVVVLVICIVYSSVWAQSVVPPPFPQQPPPFPETVPPSPPPPPPLLPPPPAPPGKREPSPLIRVFVKDIRVVGSTVFSQEELAKVTAPYTNRELSAEDIEGLRQALTVYYV